MVLDPGPDSIEDGVAAAKGPPTSPTHRQVLMDLEHLRVVGGVLQSRGCVIDQPFHLHNPHAEFITSAIDDICSTTVPVEMRLHSTGWLALVNGVAQWLGRRSSAQLADFP